MRELHRRELLGLGVVVRERAQRLGRDVGDQPRAALAQGRDRDVDLLARRLPAGEEGGARRPGRALVVGGQPPRLALLVDDVERARVRDPRHQQRHERVDALVRPARAVGQPLDRHQQLEPLVALAQAERRAADPGRVEREPHLGAAAARALPDVAPARHRGHHRQPQAEPRALRVRRHPAAVVHHPHEDRALARLGGERHMAGLAADERVDDRVGHRLGDRERDVVDHVVVRAVGAGEIRDAPAELADHHGLRIDFAVPTGGCDLPCHQFEPSAGNLLALEYGGQLGRPGGAWVTTSTDQDRSPPSSSATRSAPPRAPCSTASTTARARC